LEQQHLRFLFEERSVDMI